MADREGSERGWLRPLGLFVLVLTLSVAHPLVLVGVPFALLALLGPGRGGAGILVGAVVAALLFGGAPAAGFWYLERGWAIMVGGWLVFLTFAWPGAPLLWRALGSLAGGTASAAAVLVSSGGWVTAERLVRARFDEGAESTLALVRAVGGSEGPTAAFAEAVGRTVEVQGVVFPALLALATIAALGVAWWLYVRLAARSPEGLAPLKVFRFPDPMIWVLIAGVALLLWGNWSAGWGRLGLNLVVFMGGLYALRGAGVLVHRVRRVTVPAAVAIGLAAVLAPPLLLAGAVAVGVGDSWFDLRRGSSPERGAGGT